MLFALYRLGYKGRMSGHGFRSVASTIPNESGLWSADAIELQLAHCERNVVREVCNRAEYLPERKPMMQWWADYLDSLVSGSHLVVGKFGVAWQVSAIRACGLLPVNASESFHSDASALTRCFLPGPSARLTIRIVTRYTLAVIQSFAHKGVEKFFRTGSKAGIQARHADRLRLQLAMLDHARRPEDMNAPGWRLHPLRSNRKGHWAVTVSGNWRLTFRFDGEDAILVDYQDYH